MILLGVCSVKLLAPLDAHSALRLVPTQHAAAHQPVGNVISKIEPEESIW